MLKDKTLTYISLFSCAGVGCFGFKKAGLPIMEAGNFAGQEYLGLYPYLRYGQEEDTSKADFWVYDQETDKHITLRNWLDGVKLT